MPHSVTVCSFKIFFAVGLQQKVSSYTSSLKLAIKNKQINRNEYTKFNRKTREN